MHKFFFPIAVLIVASLATCATASVVDFTETFAAGDSNWRGADASGSDILDFFPSGGPDGSSFVSFETNFLSFPDGSGPGGGQPTPVLFRGQQNFGSSGGAFEGNWIEDNVTEFSFSFRHNIPQPVTVFSRFAPASNFPGALGIDFAPVLPNQWTEVSISIDENSAQFISFENSDFESVFSNIANLQLGVVVPEGFGGTPINFRFDIDNVQVTTAVPEPGTGLALMIVGSVCAARRRSR